MIDHCWLLDAEIMRDYRVEVIAEGINDIFLTLFSREYYLLNLAEDLVALHDLVPLHLPKREPVTVQIQIAHYLLHTLKIPGFLDNFLYCYILMSSELGFALVYQVKKLFFKLLKLADNLEFSFFSEKYVEARFLLEA